MKIIALWFIFHWSLLLQVGFRLVIIGLGNNLASSRRHYITKTNDGMVQWRIWRLSYNIESNPLLIANYLFRDMIDAFYLIYIIFKFRTAISYIEHDKFIYP